MALEKVVAEASKDCPLRISQAKSPAACDPEFGIGGKSED